MTLSSNSLYGTSMGATYGSSTNSTSSLSSKFAEALLTSLDSDSSGSVDSTEFSSAALELANGDTSAVNDAFSSLDSKKDGSISIDELTSMLSAQSTMASGSMPPPPPPPSSSMQEDTGYTKDELTAMASDVSSTDSNLASLFESLSQNFDAADTNSDGKVTSAEAQAYKESTRADSMGVANTETASSNDSLMKALLAQIISNYATQNTSIGSSVSFSA